MAFAVGQQVNPQPLDYASTVGQNIVPQTSTNSGVQMIGGIGQAPDTGQVYASGYPSYTASFPVLNSTPTDPYAGSSYQAPSGSWGMTPTPWLESAFGQYGGQYQQGTNSQAYYDSTTPLLGGPTAMSTLYSSMTAPNASAQALSGVAGAIGGPSASQQLLGQIGNQYLMPSDSSMALSGAASSLGGPSESQYRYAQNAGAYGAPTAIGQLSASNPYAQQLGGEALGRQAGSLYGNSTASQDYLASALGQANAPSELAQNAGTISGLANGASNVQNFSGQTAGQLTGPGALEQFAASALNQSNPYYALVGKEGRAAIDQAAAARGAYGAGGSLAALGNYQAHLDAENYQNMGQLQGAAQQAQMSRLGLGANIAQSASNERLAQGNALQSLYQGMFGDRMQGAQLGLSAAGQSDQAKMANLAGLTNMTQAGDQSTLARLAGQTGLAGQASASALDYLNSGMSAAGQADATQLARSGLIGQLAGQSDSQRLAGLAGLSGLASSADQAQLGRAGLIGQLAGQTDSTAQNFLNSQLNAAGQVDNNALARIALGSQMAGQADTQGLNWLNSYFNQANQAQQAGQTRVDQELQQLFQSAALQAGLYSNFYGQGGQQSVEAGTGAATALTGGASASGALQQQGNKNGLSSLLGLLSL